MSKWQAPDWLRKTQETVLDRCGPRCFSSNKEGENTSGFNPQTFPNWLKSSQPQAWQCGGMTNQKPRTWLTWVTVYACQCHRMTNDSDTDNLYSISSETPMVQGWTSRTPFFDQSSTSRRCQMDLLGQARRFVWQIRQGVGYFSPLVTGNFSK